MKFLVISQSVNDIQRVKIVINTYDHLHRTTKAIYKRSYRHVKKYKWHYTGNFENK